MAAYAFAEENDRYEVIEGVKYMAAAPFPYHTIIVDNLVGIFKSYCREKKCGVAFSDNIDVHLPDGNLFRPDVSIFCNPSSINIFGKINGVPDLVVEVLSASTMKNDRTKKKDIYERNGVREYWIVDQWKKFVEVYHSVDGKFELDEIYVLYTSEEWEALTDKEREAAQFEIKVSLFDDLFVDVREVFYWWGEELPVYNR